MSAESQAKEIEITEARRIAAEAHQARPAGFFTIMFAVAFGVCIGGWSLMLSWLLLINLVTGSASSGMNDVINDYKGWADRLMQRLDDAMAREMDRPWEMDLPPTPSPPEVERSTTESIAKLEARIEDIRGRIENLERRRDAATDATLRRNSEIQIKGLEMNLREAEAELTRSKRR